MALLLNRALPDIIKQANLVENEEINVVVVEANWSTMQLIGY